MAAEPAAERLVPDPARRAAWERFLEVVLRPVVEEVEREAAQTAGGRTPPGEDARPQTATDRTPDGTTPERTAIVPH